MNILLMLLSMMVSMSCFAMKRTSEAAALLPDGQSLQAVKRPRTEQTQPVPIDVSIAQADQLKMMKEKLEKYEALQHDGQETWVIRTLMHAFLFTQEFTGTEAETYFQTISNRLRRQPGTWPS